MLAQACLTEVIQSQFKETDYKLALIVFLHTHGRNGSYNPHLHVILAEGAFHPLKKEWKAFKQLPLAPLRRHWQKHLMALVTASLASLMAVLINYGRIIRMASMPILATIKKCLRRTTKG